MRERITTALINHRYDGEEKALRQREDALARRVYAMRYSTSQRRQMDNLPEGWMFKTAVMRVTSIRTGQMMLSMIHPAIFPYVDQHDYLDLDKQKKGAAFVDALKAFRAAKFAVNEGRKDLRRQVSQTLTAYATVGGLLKAWPEMAPFVDRLGFADPAKKLPAVIPADLNQRLSLPVSGQA
jgi:hypothetical protein